MVGKLKKNLLNKQVFSLYGIYYKNKLVRVSNEIKKILSEALGVPDNLVNLASALYDVLVDSIPDKGKFETLQNEVFEFGSIDFVDFTEKDPFSEGIRI